MNVPYTYLIGWTKLNLYYYGVRYSKTCIPEDLWNPYKTSSKYVHKIINEHGEPDLIQVRKIFNNELKARLWEEKVLRRLNAQKHPKLINKANNDAFKGSTGPIGGPWNKGLTKLTSSKLAQIGKNISKSSTGIKRKGTKKTQEQKYNNSWIQLKAKLQNIFNSYEDFIKYCKIKYEEGISPWLISLELGIEYGSVKSALKRFNIDSESNQSWTKIKKRNPYFPFSTYHEFSVYCHQEIQKGRKVDHLKKELNVSPDAIKTALKYLINCHDEVKIY